MVKHKNQQQHKKIHKTLFLLLLPFLTLASVSPGPGFPKAVLTPEDTYYSDLSSNFDLSKSFYPLTTSASKGLALNLTQPFLERRYSLHNFQKLNFVKFLTSNKIALIFDNTKIVIQNLGLNNKSFLDYTLYDLTTIGPSLFCSDLAFNQLRDLVYIGCFPIDQSGEDKSLRIHTIDLKTKTEMNVLLIKQDDGFVIRNRLMMFVQSSPQETNQENFLILYDQGNSHSQVTRDNHQIRILRNVEFGNLKFFKIIQFEFQAQKFVAVYDFLSYKNTIVVTGRVENYSLVLTMVGCKLDTTKTSLQCGDYLKPTGIAEGFIGIFGENEYFQIDTLTNEINISKLQGEFRDYNWNHEVVRTFVGADLFDDRDETWVRYFSGNEEVGVINWASRVEKQDYGVSFVAWGEDETWKIKGVSACAIRDVYLWGDTGAQPGDLAIALGWARGPYFVVDGSRLNQGDNKVEVEVKDPVSGAKNEFDVRVMTNIYERINVGDLDQVSMDSSSTKIVKIDKEKIIDGNGLQLSAKSSNPSVLTVKGATNQELIITWKPELDQSKILEIFFYENYAVVQSLENTVDLYDCVQTGPSSLTCEDHAQFTYGNDEKISTRTKRVLRNILIWSTDSENTYIRLITDDRKVHKNVINRVALDVEFIGNNPSTGYIAVVFPDFIEVYIAIYYNLDNIRLFGVINKDSAQSSEFCPRSIQLCPLSMEVLNVMSNCEGRQTIYRFPVHTLDLKISFPVVKQSTWNAGLCSMKRELLIYSNVGDMDVTPIYTMHKQPDLSYSNIPLKQFGATVGASADCIVEGDKAVVYGDEMNRKKKWLAVIESGRELQQNRRYPVILRNIEARNVRSYKGPGSDLYHVLRKSDGGFQFWVSWDQPRVVLESGFSGKTETVDVELTWSNTQNQVVGSFKVVVNGNGKVKKEGKKRMFAVE